MIGIRRFLAFDAAVPIEMASTASLGWDADLVGTRWIGAGLGGPVAVAAFELVSRYLVAAVEKISDKCQHGHRHGFSRLII